MTWLMDFFVRVVVSKPYRASSFTQMHAHLASEKVFLTTGPLASFKAVSANPAKEYADTS